MKTQLKKILLVSTFFLTLPVSLLAQESEFKKGITDLGNRISGDEGLVFAAEGEGIIALVYLITNIVQFLLGLVAFLAMLALIWGSLMYILSLGNEGRAEKAKKIMFYAIVGLVLAIISFAIIKIVQSAFAGAPGGG